MAKKFMYVCLGILALAFAYHLGASTAISQGNSVATGIATYDGRVYAITETGDCYYKETSLEPWRFYGNIFETVATQPSTLGEIKARFTE